MAKWWIIIFAVLLIIALMWGAFSFKNSKHEAAQHTEVTLENSTGKPVANSQNSTTLLTANDPSSSGIEDQAELEQTRLTNQSTSKSQSKIQAESP